MTYDVGQTKPTQTAVKVEELRLPGIDGMLPGGDVKARDKAKLDFILADWDRFISVRRKLAKEHGLYSTQCYGYVEDHLENKLLQGIDFTKKDLENFIFAKAGVRHDENTQELLGRYTGQMLTLLTKRNEEKGLPTTFYFNGHGVSFPKLFFRASYVDKVIIDNFTGDHIGCRMGNMEGKVNMVMFKDIIGYSTGLQLAGSAGDVSGGYAGLVVAMGCEGDYVCSSAGLYRGYTGVLLILDNTGEGAGQLFGCGSEGGIVAVVDSKGKDCARGVASDIGYVQIAVVVNNDDKGTLRMPGAQFGRSDDLFGTLDRVYAINCSHVDSLYDPFTKEPTVNTLFTYNCSSESWGEDHKIVKDVIEGQDALEEFKITMQEYRLNQMIDLARATSGRSEKEIIKVADVLYSVFQKTRRRLDAK